MPIHSATLILATVMAFFQLALPSVLVVLVFGVFFLRLPVSLHPLLLVILPLAAASLSGLGALIGISVRTPEEAGSLSML